jgi:hypothetical protein
MSRHHGISRGLLSVLAAISVLALPPSAARGQAAWEYAPYQVRIQLALAPAPQLTPALMDSLGQAAAARADAVLGAIWQVEASAAPSSLHDALLYDMPYLTADSISAAAPSEDLAADKLYLAAIAYVDGSYQIAVREFDCRTRQLGPLNLRVADAPAGLAPALWDAVVASFTPLARIERVEEKQVVARLRAGGLAVDATSPALVEPGMVMRPIIRRADRSGQPMKGGVQEVPWTVLAVDARRDSILECTIYSGYRAPIPARASARIERLALLVRPRTESTRLVLKARDNPEKPLAEYEVHAKAPTEEQPQLIGLTDMQGGLDLPRAEGGLQILYIRSGKQLLARLPILPGQAETIVASITDDDRRLEAEGFLAALSSRALDLVARREILAARFRARLKEGKLAEAQQLLDAFRKLESRADLNRDLNQYRQRAVAGDKLTQQRIDKLFADAQQMLLLRPLSDELLAQLTRELAAVRGAGGQ